MQKLYNLIWLTICITNVTLYKNTAYKLFFGEPKKKNNNRINIAKMRIK